MRGKRAKLLRRAAKELSGTGFADRAIVELNGTRRRRDLKTAIIETFTAVNHPATAHGRYRLLKRAYKNAKRDHV